MSPYRQISTRPPWDPYRAMVQMFVVALTVTLGYIILQVIQ